MVSACPLSASEVGDGRAWKYYSGWNFYSASYFETIDRVALLLDLKSATDRCFPVVVQELVIKSLLGSDPAMRWKALLTDRDFTIKITVSHGRSYVRDDIRVAVGQPCRSFFFLGRVCSDASLNCATRRFSVYKQWFTNYALLGDDILISHPQVAHHYQNLINVMGVPFSSEKGWYSDNYY